MRVPYLTGRYAKKHLAHHNALADAVNALSEGATVNPIGNRIYVDDDGNIVIDLTNGDLRVNLGGTDDFVKVNAGGVFEVYNGSEKIAWVSRNAATLGGTTGTPHTIAVSGSLGAALLDGNGNLAVHVDVDNNVKMPNLPTSDPGVTGALYADGDTVKRSA